jgi:hypothetical protein
MTNFLTLDALREEIEREFAPLVLQDGNTKYTLRNLLRIPSNDRKAVLAALEDVNADDDGKDVEKAFVALQTVIEKVTADGKGKDLLKKLGDDLAVLKTVLEKWTEATNPGEAEDSPA